MAARAMAKTMISSVPSLAAKGFGTADRLISAFGKLIHFSVKPFQAFLCTFAVFMGLARDAVELEEQIKDDAAHTQDAEKHYDP